MRRAALPTIALLFTTVFAFAQLHTARIFADHMVLQRNQQVPVWGTAIKGTKVSLSFNGQNLSTKADGHGYWRIVLSPMNEGGPYTMDIVSGKESLHYTDVMMGEVWLCSGQSNMEFVLQNAQGFKAEQKTAAQQNIRQFLVPHKMSLLPDKDLSDGSWVRSDTNTVAYFTAVGYFFAKKIAQQLHVTVGLIHSSWGGTQAECWISREAMSGDPNLVTRVKRVPKTWEGLKAQVDSIIHAYAFQNTPQTTYNITELAKQPASFFAQWQKGGPGAWEWQGSWASYRGSGFMQRSIRLDSSYVKKTSVLHLGMTDADLQLFINGKAIAPTLVNGNFIVNLPAGTWKGGDNSLVLELLSQQKNPSWFGLGINGDLSNVFTSFSDTTVNMSDFNWRVTPDLSKPYHFDFSPNNTVGTLYNAMIAPVVGYSVAGVLWYQGESNAGKAYQYRTTFPLLINDWRNKWGSGMPFLFVQLSSWGPTPTSNVGSDWAELREAQTMTLKLPKTGMVVTTDIGDANNIHPTDKADVGYRLAYEALNSVYQSPNNNLSPLYQSVDFKDGYVLVKLSHTDHGLFAKDPYGYIKGFEVAGPDHKWYFAKAEIVDNQVKVWAGQVSRPVAIRYAWTNAPLEANLFNKEGYPVGAFRSDDWKGVTEGK